MNEEHWERFYKKKHTLRPTSFAKFVCKFIQGTDLSVYDLGCGNGRDSYYLGKAWRVVGIDKATCPKQKGLAVFSKQEAETVVQGAHCPDLIYARFFIHTIEDELFHKILKWGQDWVAIEVRSANDDRKRDWVYSDHHRELRTNKQLIMALAQHGYDLKYFIEARGLAKYKGEDPLVVRIIAKKVK